MSDPVVDEAVAFLLKHGIGGRTMKTVTKALILEAELIAADHPSKDARVFAANVAIELRKRRCPVCDCILKDHGNIRRCISDACTFAVEFLSEADGL